MGVVFFFFFLAFFNSVIDDYMPLIQHVKKNRDPRWEEEFTFTLEEPPTNDRIYVEVISASSRMGLLHPKVHVASSLKSS